MPETLDYNKKELSTGQRGVQNMPQRATEVIATVNIYDAKILSNRVNDLVLAFDLSNRDGVQSEIRYGVQLIPENGKDIFSVDEKIYPEIVSLKENESRHFEVNYEAPHFLQGSFNIWIIAKTSTGLPLAVNKAGNVVLNGTEKYLDAHSCYLTVSGENEKKQYALDKGVDISSSENILVHCSIKSNFDFSVSAYPHLEIYARSVFGEKINDIKIANEMISLAGMEKKPVTITIPKPEKPQAYDFVLTFEGGDVVSNKTVGHFVVRGSSGSIQNAVLDKPSYSKGDMAKIKVYATPSSDLFEGSRGIGTKLPSLKLSVAVSSSGGEKCSDSVVKQFEADRGIFEVFDVLIVGDCRLPMVELNLSSGKNDLDKKTFVVRENNFENKTVEDRNVVKDKTFSLIILISVICLLVFILLLALKKRKGLAVTVIFSAVFGGGIFMSEGASADTFVTPGGDITDSNGVVHTFTEQISVVNINKSVYDPGEPLTAYGQVTKAYCSNGVYGAFLSLYIRDGNGTFTGPLVIMEILPSSSEATTGGKVAYNITTNAPLVPGSSIARFYASVGAHNVTFHDIPFTVRTPSCGTANRATLSCGDFSNCLEGRTTCSVGSLVSYNGTEPSSVNDLALHNPTTSGNWVGWDWTCGASTYCFSCLPGFVASGNTCVPVATNGSCNAAYNGQTLTSIPSTGLCSVGSQSGPYDNGTYWSWDCAGSPGGSTVYCSANKSADILADCGSNATPYTSSTNAWPSTGSVAFCLNGMLSPATPLPVFPSTPGTSINWTCNAKNGSATATCSARRNYPSRLIVCPNPVSTMNVGGTVQLSSLYFSGSTSFNTANATCSTACTWGNGCSNVTNASTWSPTINSSATVGNTSGTKGKVTANSSGTSTTTAKYASLQDSVSISVNYPAPTLTVVPDSPTVSYNGSANISWTSTDVTPNSCNLSSNPVNSQWTGSNQADSGQLKVDNITQTIRFTVSCTGKNGSFISNFADVTANASMPSLDFKVNELSVKNITVNEGSKVTLSWISTDADSCSASDDWSGNKGWDNGYKYSEETENLTMPSPKKYTLTCIGAGGTVFDTITVSLNQIMGGCGSAAEGSCSASAPNSNLCSPGKNTTVKPNGSNWVWTCTPGGTPCSKPKCGGSPYKEVTP